MTTTGPAPKTVTARPPSVAWQPVPVDRFPLDGLLRLLFEPGPAPVEDEGGGGRAPAR
jgi:hypothetical protein